MSHRYIFMVLSGFLIILLGLTPAWNLDLDQLDGELDSTGITQTASPASSATEAGKEIQDRYGIKLKVADGARGTWTPQKLIATRDTLKLLPDKFRANIKEIVLKDLNGSYDRGGIQGMATRDGQILMPSNDKFYNPGTLVHEAGHLWLFKDLDKMRSWQDNFWTKKTSPTTSRYGQLNLHEDFAESVRQYVYNGYENGAAPVRRGDVITGDMTQAHPEKYKFIQDNVMGGREYTPTTPLPPSQL